MAKKTRKPFEINLPKDKADALVLELARAIDDAQAARGANEADIVYWHTLYEQGRTRGPNRPWADAADFTSYLGTQYVDVMRASIVKTVMVEPVFTVEGYGDAETRAPFVEEFHQWQLEAEGFQQVFARAVHLSLIEPYGAIEIYEDTIKRPVRSVMRAALQLAPDGSAMIGKDLRPILQQDANGRYLPAADEATPSAEIEVDSLETAVRGPRARVLAYRDYLQLPGHAREKSEIWGHAKRFYRRLDELKERANAGIYDAEAVDAIGTDDEHASETTLANVPVGVATMDGTEQVEKELWELLFLRDLDGKGLRWFVATIHKDRRQLLRLQYDDIGRPRFFTLIPFPRANSTEGYSYIGHKLFTVIEEHTAWRNMLADDASMSLNLPVKRLTGALWDPDTEPMGPKAVISVRSMNEVEFMQRQNNTSIAVERIRDCERTGERLAGINDASAGITSQQQRTLGEVEIITAQSQGRVSEAVKNIQETLEEIAQVRHVIWKRALNEMTTGLQAPPSVAQAVALRTQQSLAQLPESTNGVALGNEQRTQDISGAGGSLHFTAAMLEGQFRFKPRGSVENADPGRQRYDFNQWLVAMSNMAKVNPTVAAILQTPQAAKAMIEQGVRLYHVQDKQAFLGSEAMAAAQQAVQMQMQMQIGMPGPSQAIPPQPPGQALPPSPMSGQAA